MKQSKRLWRMEVDWRDSYIELSSWTPIERMRRNRKRLRTNCTSVGFVLADDKRGVMLAGSVNGGNATGVIVIPAGQIVAKRSLR